MLILSFATRLTVEIALLSHLTIISPSLSPDFTGYSLTLPKRYNALLLISVSGRFKPFSTSEKSLTAKMLYKIYKYLLRINFIRNGVNDPFPEFETYSNIRVNFSHARVFDENIFINLSKQETKNV